MKYFFFFLYLCNQTNTKKMRVQAEEEQDVVLPEYTPREIWTLTQNLLSAAEWSIATPTEQLNLLRRHFVYNRLPDMLREPFNDEAVYASTNSHIVRIMILFGTFSAQNVIDQLMNELN